MTSESRIQVRGYKRLWKFKSFLTLNSYLVDYMRLDGKRSGSRELVDVFRRDAVAALLHREQDGKHEFSLVNQFRFSTVIDPDTGQPDLTRDGFMVELMAGVRQDGEPLREALRRETKEETGYDILEEEHICSFYPSPGALSEQIHVYYAKLKPADAKTENREFWGDDEDGEHIKRERLSPQEFLSRIRSGDIRDSKCIVAAEWIQRPENRRRFGVD
jgi:ADP-ribose pyrophosphatase